MNPMIRIRIFALLLCTFAPKFVLGAEYPAPTEGDYTVRDFKFASGETLPELRIHYRTLGKPEKDRRAKRRNAVLIMHGTTGSGAQFIRPEFAGELFRKGSAARCDEIFHRVTGWDWPRQIEQTERRHAREVPALRLSSTWLKRSFAC